MTRIVAKSGLADEACFGSLRKSEIGRGLISGRLAE